MKRWIIIFILLNAGGIYSKTDSLRISNKLLKELRKVSRIEGERIGITGVKSKIYPLQDSLWKISSIEKLAKLTDDRSAVVRCIAFAGLIRKNADKNLLKEIADKHDNDSGIIEIQNGCIGWKTSVSEFMKMRMSI